jgi:undecaprenyl diphosphate synthase
MQKAEEMTKDNIKMTAIIAIGYGGQEEVVRAVRSLASAG